MECLVGGLYELGSDVGTAKVLMLPPVVQRSSTEATSRHRFCTGKPKMQVLKKRRRDSVTSETRHRTEERRRNLCSVLVVIVLLPLVSAKSNQRHNNSNNRPPKFVLDDLEDGVGGGGGGRGGGDGGGDIVVRLKEGAATPPGSRILRLRAFDPDGDHLTFGVLGDRGSDGFLRIENHPDGDKADVFLNRVLDAETQSEFQAVLTLTDGRLGQGNFITRSLLLLVEDDNDNAPVFLPFPSAVSEREHSTTFPKVLLTLKATDRDRGIFGQVVYSLLSDDGGPFTVRTTSDGRGLVSVVGELDYEKKSVYELVVVASDQAGLGGGSRVNSATAAILIKVLDVSDRPPEFVSAPPVTRVPEDVERYSEVLRVRAVDGDRGVGRPIVYSLFSGPTDLFAINSDSGVVYTQTDLDRESPRSSNGAFILGVRAREVGGSDQDEATIEVTVILEDVNDETPTFASPSYTCEIGENAPKGTPLTFLGESSPPEVRDHDLGSNGTFRLFIEQDDGMFEVSPSEGINDARFLLRVKDPSLLDYERLRLVNFTLVAKEISTSRLNRAVITVHVRDQNDNAPEFSQHRYEVEVSEDVSAGATLAWVRATDRDSGVFGTDGVRYTRLSGPSASLLHLDERTGIVSVASTISQPFDREASDLHYLTVEARDDLGRGNRQTVELLLRITDVNDQAPVFRQEVYETFLVENSADFASPLVLEADDADEEGSDAAHVRYFIASSSGAAEANFSIDANSGRLRPNGPVDYERMSAVDGGEERLFRLFVRARDQGNPSLFSDVTVNIFVLDENDHSPVFERTLYEVSVDEDLEGGTPIIQVSANDGDGSSPNNLVNYRIQSGARDKFVVDPDTGIISVSRGASLDPDMATNSVDTSKSFFMLEMLALDGGLGSKRRSSTTLVNITVIDVNNKPPIFRHMAPVTVKENVHTGHLLGTLEASDLDSSAELRFSIDFASSEAFDETGLLLSAAEASLGRLFEVDPASGDMRVVGAIDREKVEKVKLAVMVEDIKAKNERQVASSVFVVNIGDVNDNSPVFRREVYLASVMENSARGTHIVRVHASDVDKNRTVTYSLESANSLLQLDPDTGELLVGGENIDAELVNWLNVTVRATDSGRPPRSSFAEVSVRVLDENDNGPVFDREAIVVKVSEATSVGTVIARIHASDADRGEFGKVKYFLGNHRRTEEDDGDNDDSHVLVPFAIDPDSGELSLSQNLDRERRSSYSLLIEAYDNYQFGFATGSSRRAFAQVSVTVQDENDEAPIFEKSSKSKGCSALVSEFHEPIEPVLTLRANDADDPNTDNGRVFFEIVSGNELGLFRIEQRRRVNRNGSRGTRQDNEADLFPARHLKGFYGNYTLVMEARDKGFPPNFARANFVICVQDFNDNPPRFVSPPSNYTIRVLENATVGSQVVAVRAVDDDVGVNGDVRYRIIADRNDFFDVDSVSGIVTLARPLDRERQRVHELRVEAFDLGEPTPLATDLDLVVYVSDVNDHSPQFLIDEFEASFTEHKPPGAERVLLVGTVDRDHEDDFIDLDVCYFIVDGNDERLFEVLPREHELLFNRELDREERSEYTLTVKATEECLSPPPARQRFRSNDDSLLLVRVSVVDIDDNSPRFSKDVFTGGISTDAEFGAAFMRVLATDDDVGENARLSFSVRGNIEASDESEGLENIQEPPFLVNSSTGDVLLNFDPQRGMKGYFSFEVIASDLAGHMDEAKVLIYLLREDQRVKFVMRAQPGEIRPRIGRFLRALAAATDAVVSADAFRVHHVEGRSGDGAVDKTKTDVLLHFVDPRDNTVMEVEDVLRLIDYRIEELVDIFKEFNVIDTEGATEGSAALRAGPGGADHGALVFWLAGACAFLLLLLVLLSCLLAHTRRKYLRRLRAATTDAYSDPNNAVVAAANADTSLNKRQFVPNTNRHASEGSNPIWMTGVAYDNLAASDDDDGDEDDEDVLRQAAASSGAQYEVGDSLDANVLNDYSHHSTIRVGSKLDGSAASSSSGLGSGASRLNDLSRGGPNGIYSKSRSISALFPSQMPPVDKLGCDRHYGSTTYDEENVPRTEL